MTKQPGIVYLIGAGPGHPGLITRLGYDILHRADAVVYDDLIPTELIAELLPDVKRHYVGKRAGKLSLPQAEINDLLVKLAQRGMTVARLKGGDPLIFGRSGEEMDALSSAGIPTVIIPGVTALTAVAATAGITLTDRRVASWILLATGREADSPSPVVPWREIAGLSGGTLAVYMGLSTLKRIVGELLAGGMAPQTPVMVVSKAYNGTQRTVAAPLFKLDSEVQQAGLDSPALVIIGEAISFRHPPYGGWQSGALFGKRIMVTRPAGEAARMCELLRAKGAEPLILPTICTESYEDLEGWGKIPNLVGASGMVVFTSAVGVRHFIAGLLQHGLDLRILGGFKIAAIGSGTADALRRAGLKADLQSAGGRMAALAKELRRSADLKGKVLLRVRGDRSDDAIERMADEVGAVCLPLTVYRTSPADWDERQKALLIEKPPDWITFTSGSTVDSFVKILGETAAREACRKSKTASIGPSTTQMARRLGLEITVEAKVHTVEGLIKALVAAEATPLPKRPT